MRQNKSIDRKNWSSIKNLETFELKTKNGKSMRVIYDPKTNLVELIVDHTILQDCNKLDNFQPVIKVEGFYND